MYCFKNGNDCPYKNICKDKTINGDCYKMCGKLNEIDTLFYNANIPRAFLQPIVLYPSRVDVAVFEILLEVKNNIAMMVEEGFNLTIYSGVRGSGKTSWGIKILQNYLHQIWNQPGSRTRGLYVDVVEYFTELKAEFDTKERNAKEFAKDIDMADLVIFDNIDECRLSEWERTVMKQHIKKRNNNGLSNIFITRYKEGQLVNMIGEDLEYYVVYNSQTLSILEKGGRVK
jgi:DNA replication protein DnaC